MAIIQFLKPKNTLEEGGRAAAPVQEDAGEPEKTCPNCHQSIPLSRLWANSLVCPCGYHFRMKTRQQITMIADKDSFRELYPQLHSGNPLRFPDYTEKLDTVRTASGETEAVLCGTAAIGGIRCCLFAMEPYFMMGSMGSAVGEKITALFEYAAERHLPAVGFPVSGGARMQEGLLSLMQMAKTSAAVKRHSDAGQLYLAVLTDPTTGGMTASFAMEADIILAEPGATIGFAGARVIEQTTRKTLPKGFQQAEFVLQHGFIDGIAPRAAQRELLTRLLRMHQGDDNLSQVPYAIVKMARDSARPTGLDYINHIFQGFVELHGDRRFGDDPAIVGGIAMLGDVPVTVIAIEKGHTARERSQRSFGAPHPEGCASILWNDAKKAEEAAASLKLTAEDAAGLGVVDRVLSERDIGKEPFYTRIRDALTKELAALAGDPELLTKRYNRFRRMGVEAVRETL